MMIQSLQHFHLRSWSMRRVGVTALCSVAAGLLACSDGTGPEAPLPDPANVLWGVSVAQRGITMALTDTVKLSVVAINILGDTMPVPDSLPIQFISERDWVVAISPDGTLDPQSVTVSQGLLNPVAIFASWQWNGATKIDTIFVVVTETRPAQPVVSLSLSPKPYPQDSSWGGKPTGSKIVPVTAMTANGDTVPNVYAHLFTQQRRRRLNDPIDQRTNRLQFKFPPGRFWVYAEAFAYGHTIKDSMEYINTDAIVGGINLRSDPNISNSVIGDAIGTTQTLAPCALVGFQNTHTDTLSFSFDTSDVFAKCTPIDQITEVIDLPPGRIVFRRIRAEGTYRWTATRSNGIPFRNEISGFIRIRNYTEF